MKVIFVDPFTEDVVESDSCELPEGWMIPETDLSVDEPKAPLPYGVVVALSSRKSQDLAANRKFRAST